MQASPASSSERPFAFREGRTSGHRDTCPLRETLIVDEVGYLVPIEDFEGTVHSTFARACNFAWGDSLLTLMSGELSAGPTTLRLAPGLAPDFRLILRPGDRLRCRDGIASTASITLHLAGATTWRPAPPPSPIAAWRSRANLRFAAAALASFRRDHSSVVDREGDSTLAGLAEACRNLDLGQATQHIERLIGWGEGLTPAGDDALVGLLAALDAIIDGRPDRRLFLQGLSAAIMARTSRTTPIAAHCLRLAAHGHFNADAIRLRNALLGELDMGVVAEALFRALDAGATSGADMVTGLLCGFSAWADLGFPRQ